MTVHIQTVNISYTHRRNTRHIFLPNDNFYLMTFFLPLPEVSSEKEIQWCFSQVKGTIEDEVADGEGVLILMLVSGRYLPVLTFLQLISFPRSSLIMMGSFWLLETKGGVSSSSRGMGQKSG